ncbi:MAG TPA: sugar phosphate isomerase/epimerase family protein [Clostridia bacterium]|nr:sugar phosphate isomerase/epimerase family protein [Clostridia bacterium]
MKISFSTLGCPDWSWKEIFVTAMDLGYDGIEIRGIGKEMYIPRLVPFLPENIENTKEQLYGRNIEIPCLTSSCFLFGQDKEKYLKEGKEYIDIAAKLGVPYIRVLGDKDPNPGINVDKTQVSHMLNELGNYALGKDVMVLIETNGLYADSKTMKDLMLEVDHPQIGVLWDIHHPYRYFNEPMVETYGRLKDYIHHVHVKDSHFKEGEGRYCLLGEGDIPVKEALRLLSEEGYEGYVSLEWVKRWYYDLEEPGIVFSHFINVIREMS